VGSAVIKLTRYEKPPVEVYDERLMFRLIRASFNQRRKTLVNGIKNSGDFSLGKEDLERIFEKCNLPLNIRGEALTLEQFAELANCIYEENK
jgi:16S rRNA (adenine1518-N6/adenine1519-N6)-dimethyltransferase